MNFKNNLKKLSAHISLYRKRQLVIVFCIMIVASFMEAVSIGLVVPFLSLLVTPENFIKYKFLAQVINLVDVKDPQQILLPITCFFVIAVIFAGLMRILLIWGQTRIGFAIGADLSFQIYRKTLYQPYSVHLARNSSDVIAGISRKTNEIVGNVLIPILMGLSSGLMLLVILSVLFLMNPIVSFFIFSGLGLIYGLIIFLVKKQLMHDGKIISKESVKVIKALQEGLGGIRDVLIDGVQSTYCHIYLQADIPLRRAQANISIMGAIPRPLIEAFGMAAIAYMAYYLTTGNGSSIESAIPVMGLVALGAQRLLPVLQQLYYSWATLRSSMPSLEDVLQLLDQKLPIFATEEYVTPLKFTQAIELNNVSFKYTDNSNYVLREVNLVIPRGSRLGIIGKTGSAKSTLLDIVMSLLMPVQGQMLVDGVLINADNCREWQMQIGHVSQSIFLADATIAENIAFGVPVDRIDYKRVHVAAQQAQISEVIESWDMQYHTVIGERGVRLSGGQRQRIGIARALYKQAKVMVFDEATSALDNETETAVMSAIEMLGTDTTIIIIAHRLSTLKCCNRIIKLVNGGVEEVPLESVNNHHLNSSFSR